MILNSSMAVNQKYGKKHEKTWKKQPEFVLLHSSVQVNQTYSKKHEKNKEKATRSCVATFFCGGEPKL